MLALLFTLSNTSFLGIPPLLGFFQKVLLYAELLSSLNIIITVFLVLIGLISVYYYLRLLKVIFFNKSSKWIILRNIPLGNSIILTLLSIILVLILPIMMIFF